MCMAESSIDSKLVTGQWPLVIESGCSSCLSIHSSHIPVDSKAQARSALASPPSPASPPICLASERIYQCRHVIRMFRHNLDEPVPIY